MRITVGNDFGANVDQTKQERIECSTWETHKQESRTRDRSAKENSVLVLNSATFNEGATSTMHEEFSKHEILDCVVIVN